MSPTVVRNKVQPRQTVYL